MFYLRYLFYSVVQHILCWVFVLFFIVMGTLLAVSLDCPFALLLLQYSFDKKLFCIVFDFLSYIVNMYNCTYKTHKIETESRGNMVHLYVRFACPTLFQHLGQSPVCLCLFLFYICLVFVQSSFLVLYLSCCIFRLSILDCPVSILFTFICIFI